MPQKEQLRIFAEYMLENRSETELAMEIMLIQQFPDQKFASFATVDEELVVFYNKEQRLAIDVEDGNHDHSDAWFMDLEKKERLARLGVKLLIFTEYQVFHEREKIIAIITSNMNANPLSRVKLKVCGMRDPENIATVSADAKPDYMGFIFYENSKRFVGEGFMYYELDPEIKRVGVFVDASEDYIMKKVVKYLLNAVQLHGNESPELCEKLKNRGVTVIKVFSIDNDFDFSVLNHYKFYVDFFLFDTKGKEHGGNGVTFDWSILKNYDGEKPFFLSGGIGIEEIDKVKELDLAKLNLYGLDVNSRFETKPGEKDVEKLSQLKSLMV